MGRWSTGARHAAFMLCGALLAACSGQQVEATLTDVGPTPTPVVTTPASARTKAPSYAPGSTTLESFGPADLSARPLVWYAPLPPMPGRTGSVDFMDQFTPDAPWQSAATQIDVYKLYGEWVAYHASDDELRMAIADIARRGMVLAVEAGPLDPPADCGQNVESFAGADEGRLIAERVIRAGGRIAVITLDEPYFFGHVYDDVNACHLDVAAIAANVASYVDVMRGYFPELIVGDIEPTPAPVSRSGLTDWLDAYERAAGEPFSFLHLDFDWGRPDWEGLGHDIQAAAAGRGVPLGVIYNGGSAPDRAQWIQIAGDRVKSFDSSGAAPDHYVFQSWMVQPDHALPDSDPTTFSGLVRTWAEDPASLGTPTSGPGANIALGRSARASAELAESPASAAVDGDFDTLWNAGDSARQWIEITFDEPSDVGGIRLTVSQYPAGATVHRVLGRTTGGDLVELHRFDGPTADGDVLSFAPDAPWGNLAGIRIETLSSPSWVAWREIEIDAS